MAKRQEGSMRVMIKAQFSKRASTDMKTAALADMLRMVKRELPKRIVGAEEMMTDDLALEVLTRYIFKHGHEQEVTYEEARKVAGELIECVAEVLTEDRLARLLAGDSYWTRLKLRRALRK